MTSGGSESWRLLVEYRLRSFRRSARNRIRLWFNKVALLLTEGKSLSPYRSYTIHSRTLSCGRDNHGYSYSRRLR